MRLLWTSDQHVFHQITPTAHILNNLTTFLRKEHDLAKVDMVSFGGDFFERMVELPHPDTHLVFEWAKTFLHKAYELNPAIQISILAGTSSHDWEQPKHFLTLAPEGMRIEYIDTLCIKTYDHLDGLTVMYVPDNMGTATPDEIWERALAVLQEAGLEKVDMIHFHGAFEFQLPTKVRHKAHNLARWSSIVRLCILAGHIHTPVQSGLLYTSGSFDRTRHGEEHPKGGYVVDFDLKNNKFSANFWENKNALPYVTLKVNSDITAEDLIVKFHDFVKRKKLPRHSQIRVMGGSAMVVNPVLGMLSKEYPNYGIKAENEKNADELIDDVLFSTDVYNGISLTKSSLPDNVLVVESVTLGLNKYGVSEAEARKVLSEFL